MLSVTFPRATLAAIPRKTNSSSTCLMNGCGGFVVSGLSLPGTYLPCPCRPLVSARRISPPPLSPVLGDGGGDVASLGRREAPLNCCAIGWGLFGLTAIIFGGGLGGIATISANTLRVSGVSGNDHCLRSGFHCLPGISFDGTSIMRCEKQRAKVVPSRAIYRLSLVRFSTLPWIDLDAKMDAQTKKHRRRTRKRVKPQVFVRFNIKFGLPRTSSFLARSSAPDQRTFPGTRTILQLPVYRVALKSQNLRWFPCLNFTAETPKAQKKIMKPLW